MLNLYATLVSLVALAKDRIRARRRAPPPSSTACMVGLIAVAIIVTVGLLGDQLNALFDRPSPTPCRDPAADAPSQPSRLSGAAAPDPGAAAPLHTSPRTHRKAVSSR